jgi:hypothetical protein
MSLLRSFGFLDFITMNISPFGAEDIDNLAASMAVANKIVNWRRYLELQGDFEKTVLVLTTT